MPNGESPTKTENSCRTSRDTTSMETKSSPVGVMRDRLIAISLPENWDTLSREQREQCLLELREEALGATTA